MEVEQSGNRPACGCDLGAPAPTMGSCSSRPLLGTPEPPPALSRVRVPDTVLLHSCHRHELGVTRGIQLDSPPGRPLVSAVPPPPFFGGTLGPPAPVMSPASPASSAHRRPLCHADVNLCPAFLFSSPEFHGPLEALSLGVPGGSPASPGVQAQAPAGS